MPNDLRDLVSSDTNSNRPVTNQGSPSVENFNPRIKDTLDRISEDNRRITDKIQNFSQTNVDQINQARDSISGAIDVVGSGYDAYVANPINNSIQSVQDILRSSVDAVLGNNFYTNWIQGTGLGSVIENLRSGITEQINKLKSIIADPRQLVMTILNNVVSEYKNKIGINKNPQSSILSANRESYDMVGLDSSVFTTAGKLAYMLLNANNYPNSTVALNKGDQVYDFIDVPFQEHLGMYQDSSSPSGYSQAIYGTITQNDPIDLSFKGWKSVNGLTIGSNHLWDLKLEVPKVGDSYGLPISFLPALPEQYVEYQPIIDYDFDYYELSTQKFETPIMDLDLFTGIELSGKLDINLLEDDNYTWRRYTDAMIRRLYSTEYNAVAPYKQSVFVATLILFNTIKMCFYRKMLLVHPTNIVRSHEGSSEADEADNVKIQFTVVGDLNSNIKASQGTDNLTKNTVLV